MFFFFSFSICETETITLKHGISYVTQCANSNTDLHLISPNYHNSNFVIALIKKPSEKPNISYAHPVGTNPKQFNMTFPAYSFPDGDAEIIVSLKKDECATFAYASILKSACLDSINIVVSQDIEQKFESKSEIRDDCTLFAPYLGSTIKQFAVGVNSTIKTNSFYVYSYEMVHGPHYTFTSPNRTEKVIQSENPVIFRMSTTDTNHKSIVYVKSNIDNKLENPLSYSGEVKTVPIQEKGVLSHSLALPIIGCAPPLILLCAWIYAFIRISKKKPVENK